MKQDFATVDKVRPDNGLVVSQYSVRHVTCDDITSAMAFYVGQFEMQEFDLLFAQL